MALLAPRDLDPVKLRLTGSDCRVVNYRDVPKEMSAFGAVAFSAVFNVAFSAIFDLALRATG